MTPIGSHFFPYGKKPGGKFHLTLEGHGTQHFVFFTQASLRLKFPPLSPSRCFHNNLAEEKPEKNTLRRQAADKTAQEAQLKQFEP